MTSEAKDKPDNPDKQHHFQIQIDRAHYEVTQSQLTGTELRATAQPPIGADRDLYLVVPGGTDDKVENEEPVEVKSGLRFYTTPALINPGRL